jgi:hypothetical protein
MGYSHTVSISVQPLLVGPDCHSTKKTYMYQTAFAFEKMFLKFSNQLENKDFRASNFWFQAHTCIWLCHLVHTPLPQNTINIEKQ